MSGIPYGFKEDSQKFTVGSVGETAEIKQLTELLGSIAWVIKDIEVYFSGTALSDSYFHLNSAVTDDVATRFGERYYKTGSFLHFEGAGNGALSADLATKPYIHISAGVGSVAQTVYGTIKYFYK